MIILCKKGEKYAIGCAFVLAPTAYFGIKNFKFVKAFVGAPNPVFEDRYVDLNGQEQFIRFLRPHIGRFIGNNGNVHT